MDDYFREQREAALFRPKPVKGNSVSGSELPLPTNVDERDRWWPGEDESYLTPEMLAAHWKELHPGIEEDDDEEI